jgi:hypothetical protein
MRTSERPRLLRSHLKEDTIPKPVGLGSLSSAVNLCQDRVKRSQEHYAHVSH